MALPLKSGADLYTQELLRARLHNYDGDLSEYGVGSIYYNTTSGLNTSDRIRYRGRSAWHSVANLEDITRLEELIAELGDVSGENITDLLNRIKDAEGDIEAVEVRVKTIEDDYLTDDDKQALSALITTLQGYFSNGVANNAAKLGGQLPSYYAQSSVLGQLRTEFDALYKTLNDDTAGVINTWQEVVDFVNEYSGSENLSTILAGMNNQIDNRYTKGEVDTKLSAYRLLTNGVFDVLVNANNGIVTDEITIGGIKLSVVEGQLQIDGDAFATGQLASGGIGEAGSGSGASGIVILEDWSKYDDSVAQVVGAVLGKDLHDRLGVAESTLESLVGKATNVSVVQTLTSGKEIGAITIDGVATKLYAPATYAWGEITSKPTTLAGYEILDAVRFFSSQQGNYGIKTHLPAVLVGYTGEEKDGVIGDYGILNIPTWAANGTSSYYAFQIYSTTNGGNLNWRQVTASANGSWKKLLDNTNYATTLDNAYLKLSGGTIAGGIGALNIKRNADSSGSFIAYSNNTWTLGYLGVNSSFEPSFTKDGSAYHTLLHEGNYESIVGNKFLKLTGGTITTDSSWAFVIQRNSDSASYVCFNNINGTLGYLGVSADSTPRFMDANGVAQLLLHEGNFNTYAPTLTGTGASGTWGINISGSAAMLGGRSASQFVHNNLLAGRIDANATGGTTTSFYSEYRWDNTPVSTIGTLLETFYSAGWKSQLFIPIQRGENKIYFRHYSSTSTDNVWGDWKTLAFTDSDITGNAASATKLASARSFWGNLFDGTGDVTGGIAFNSVQKISWHSDADGYYIRSSVFTGATNPSLEFCAWGGHYFSSQGVTRLIINQAGNVSIGAADSAGSDYRLHVGSSTFLDSYKSSTQVPTLGNTGTGSHTVIGAGPFGLQIWSNSTGSTSMQVHRFDGTATAYDLLLQQLGGNVIVGGAAPIMLSPTNKNNPFIKFSVADGYVSFMQVLQVGTLCLGKSHTDLSITQSGSVGIGTISPVARLHIYGDSSDGYALKVNGHTSLTAGLTVTGGYISMPTEYGLLFDSSEVLYKATNGSLRFGYCQGWSGQITYISGANIVFNFGGSAESEVMRMTNVGLILATNKTLKIGDATLSWDSTSNALKVDKDFYSDGQVSSGGVAEEGTGGAVGGSGLERVVFTIPANTTTFDCVHNLGTREISVAIYEEGNDYQQILTDVYLDSTNIARVVFGSATDVAHKVVIIG